MRSQLALLLPALALLLAAAPQLQRAAAAAPPQPGDYRRELLVGFLEGARRRLSCGEAGGYVTGLQGWQWHVHGFAEPSINALRVKCSSGKAALEYAPGLLPDTAVFGVVEPSALSIHADCPPGQGIAAIEWRRGSVSDKDNTARIAGLRIHCGAQDGGPTAAIDSRSDRDYPLAARCSDTPAPPAGSGGAGVRLTALDVWYEQMLSGLMLGECEAAPP